MRTYDAVVIGAGHNGLVAANLLADEGWHVLVLEATRSPGGAVQTTELTAPGFRNDVCSAFYPLGASSPVLADLKLERYGLAWRHAPQVLAHIFADDRCAVLSRDLEATAASVSTFAAADADAWAEEARRWRRIGEPLLETFLRPFPPVRNATRLLRAMGAAEAARFARLTMLPVRRYGMERFRGDGARMLVAGNALHTDLGPEDAGSAVFGWLLAMLGQSVGFPVPQGGAGRLTSALVRRLEARGGEIECDRRVGHVLHARRIAVGVRCQDGEQIRARRAVVADVPAPQLYQELVGLEALPGAFVRDLNNFWWDNATVKIDWALSRPIEWSAPAAREAGVVHLDADLDGLSAYASDLARGARPSTPFMLLGQMTKSDPSRSPAGTESVWAYSHVPQSIADDNDEMLRHADLMQEVIERHAPGFSGAILKRHVDLPQQMQEHNPSLLRGALNGGTAAPYQQLVFRPTVGLARADTPVDRLFLASASAHPGGGVHGACGANAARAALARSGAFGGGYRALISAAHRRLYPAA